MKTVLARLLEAYAEEHELRFDGFGNATARLEPEQAGLEPDECHFVGREEHEGSFPDLAIDVVYTSGGVDKLEIYRRLGVKEVWFWIEDAIEIPGSCGRASATRTTARARRAPLPDIHWRRSRVSLEMAAIRRRRFARIAARCSVSVRRAASPARRRARAMSREARISWRRFAPARGFVVGGRAQRTTRRSRRGSSQC